MTHCQQLYESIMTSLEMYKDLTSNSACEASRKLRSVRASCKTQLYSKSPIIDSKLANCSKSSTSIVPKLAQEDATRNVTLISVALNLFFITIVFVKLLIRLNSCQMRRDRQKFIRKSFRSDLKQSQAPITYDQEETRNALLEAFELSRRC
jgi:hypothetical protein